MQFSDAFIFLSDAIVRNTGISEITDMTILPGPKIIKLFSCSTQLCMKFTCRLMLKFQQFIYEYDRYI